MVYIDLNPTMIDIWTYQNRNSHSNSAEKWKVNALGIPISLLLRLFECLVLRTGDRVLHRQSADDFSSDTSQTIHVCPRCTCAAGSDRKNVRNEPSSKGEIMTESFSRYRFCRNYTYTYTILLVLVVDLSRSYLGGYYVDVITPTHS